MRYQPGGRRRYFGPGKKQRSISTGEKFLSCPVCGQMVKVGGPNQHGVYVTQPHAPAVVRAVNELCRGTGTTVKTSP